MKEHESVLVFSAQTPNYYPIMEARKGSGLQRIRGDYKTNSKAGGDCLNNLARNTAGKKYSDLRNPSSVQMFNNRGKGDTGLHPTQKPVALCEYFIKTYSKEGDTVLDFTMGSGTTGVACRKLNRKFIGIELNADYFLIAQERITHAVPA